MLFEIIGDSIIFYSINLLLGVNVYCLYFEAQNAEITCICFILEGFWFTKTGVHDYCYCYLGANIEELFEIAKKR